MIAYKSTTNLYETNICLYILAFGFATAKSTIRLIVSLMVLIMRVKLSVWSKFTFLRNPLFDSSWLHRAFKNVGNEGK